METIDLQAEVRDKVGGREPRRLRKEGVVPGVVYGNNTEPISIQVERRTLEHALHTSAGENVVVTLKFEGGKEKDVTVILKAVQHHIVKDHITHVDFQVISLTEKIQVRVHVHVKGEPIGVQQGGMLDFVHHEIDVECLPTNIPDLVKVNVSALNINESVHVKDLALPEGVECLNDPEDVVLVVHPPQAEKEEGEEELEGEEASTEPEVIKKGKEDSEE